MRGFRLFIEAPRAEGMPYALDVCGDDYTGYGDDEAREKNMRFIVHAANAYPKLVEALRGIALSYPETDEGVTTASVARETLQEIGEPIE